MDAVREFRSAVESRDFSGLEALFDPDVVFHSPVKFTPFAGREMVLGLLRVVLETFEDFRYVGELDGTVQSTRDSDVGTLRSSVLVFRAAVGETQIHGIDLISTGESGLIEEFTVMVRPLRAAQALSDAVGSALVEAGLLPAPG